jgi:hypothetical protein
VAAGGGEVNRNVNASGFRGASHFLTDRTVGKNQHRSAEGSSRHKSALLCSQLAASHTMGHGRPQAPRHSRIRHLLRGTLAGWPHTILHGHKRSACLNLGLAALTALLCVPLMNFVAYENCSGASDSMVQTAQLKHFLPSDKVILDVARKACLCWRRDLRQLRFQVVVVVST